jgi:hypothetical protein
VCEIIIKSGLSESWMKGAQKKVKNVVLSLKNSKWFQLFQLEAAKI